MLWTIYLDDWYVGTYRGVSAEMAYENMAEDECEPRSFEDYKIVEVDDPPDHGGPLPCHQAADEAQARWYAWRIHG